MRILILCSAIAAVCGAVLSSPGLSQEKKAEKPDSPTSNQALMRDKLVQVNRILEGITLDKFDQVAESAQTLRAISKATSWHIVDQTPQYKRLSRNFQEQAADLERHAQERNVEAATLDLVRMNITCTHCHQHMRETGTGRK